MNAQLLEWDALWDAMDQNPETWVSTTPEMYWEMLGVLPPRKMIGENFLVGEPLRHNAQGQAVYACFTKFGDSYRARNLTVQQFMQLHQ